MTIPRPEFDASRGEPDGGHDARGMLPETGIGTGDLYLQRLVPDHGPYTGGQSTVLRGNGFAASAWTVECEAADTCGLILFDGAMVQPADIRYIDSHRISVVVPAGEVGQSAVEIIQGDARSSLPEGYYYDAFYVDPGRGSVAGGTYVTLVGMGTSFAEGDAVTFGGVPCTDVTVVSAARITCRAPPMIATTVDVVVTAAADGSTITAEDAYMYYDTADPFRGGLGGGPIAGAINLTALNAASGEPVAEAFAIVGEDLGTTHQGLTDVAGQITFSGSDLAGEQTIHVAKHCYEKTSVVAFDASDVTVFLVPWEDPMCGMGMPPTGRGRNGAFVSGELVWYGPNEYGPNPWLNVPEPRPGETKVAYVYTTRDSVDEENPDPSLGGAVQRVLESPLGTLGYPYRIFARPAGLAVYALAGLEIAATGEFVPYVMGVARGVLAGPGEEVTGVNVYMDIPLDHAVNVILDGLPMAVDNGPDRFRVTANIDLGGEGIIVREVGADVIDIVRAHSAERAFRFTAQPALYGALADARYSFEAGWFTGGFDSEPLTVRRVAGVLDVAAPVAIDGFLGVPQATAPEYGAFLPEDRVLRWVADGPAPDFHVVRMFGGDGNPAWRHFLPGNVTEAPIPDLSAVPGVDDISSGYITWAIFAVKIPGFVFNEFTYAYLSDRYWTHYSIDSFAARF